MRVKAIQITAALLIAGTAAGCMPEYRPEAHGEGDTSAHNFLLQAVNPRPNETTVPPDQDGQRADAAYERYRDGRVIIPKKVSTSDIGGSGPGSGAK